MGIDQDRRCCGGAAEVVIQAPADRADTPIRQEIQWCASCHAPRLSACSGGGVPIDRFPARKLVGHPRHEEIVLHWELLAEQVVLLVELWRLPVV